LIVAILKGEDRIDKTKLQQESGIEDLKMATSEQVLEKTGYPAGGVPSFGFPAKFLIDKKVLEKEFVYTGGGSEFSLVKVTPPILRAANAGRMADIRQSLLITAP
jgi:Cys-tRNA(Pro)/Cys-tRNA(Cys) deacylase